MTRDAAGDAFDWILDEELKVTAIAGICKNAGKTTLLNHLLSLLPEFRLGVFSTGIDGEETDSVFRIPKPRVRLAKGTLFCCDTANLDQYGSAVTVVERLTGSDVLRPLWLVRAELPLAAEITGPASVNSQTGVLDRLFACGTDKALIDGSLDRKSVVLSPAVDAVVILLGASYGSLSSISLELRRLQLLNQLPVADLDRSNPMYDNLLSAQTIWLQDQNEWRDTHISSLLGQTDTIKRLLEPGVQALYIPGSLTDAVAAKLHAPLREAGIRLLFRHPDCLKLTQPKLERLLQDITCTALIPFGIRSFVLNSRGVGAPDQDASEFRARLRREFPHLNLPDIRELAS